MPLFQQISNKLAAIEQSNFSKEKALQNLIEGNLPVVFNCRFIASEYPTGALHAGRIDTLALSEDFNPVIIEYKKVESSDLINQSLFYLHWIHDHRGDFELAAQKVLGNSIKVDWTDVRVICIAPNYKKYDLHAVQVMGANIELWTYRLFKNSTVYLEEVLKKTTPAITGSSVNKNPIMVAAGKKAALTRLSSNYSFEEHLSGKPEHLRQLAIAIQEFILGLDASIEEAPKKFYIAYRISQNIVCMEIRKQRVLLYLKLDPGVVSKAPTLARDVTNIGHYGTGDVELAIKKEADLKVAQEFIEKAYHRVGG